jgi:hypothetical protein
MFPVLLCGDVAGAYHTVDVDVVSSYLGLFFYYWDLPGCSKPRIFRQTSQSFGDGGAAQGLEVVILKFVVATAVLLVTRYILEAIRYNDNILYSFKSKKEFMEVKEDLKRSFDHYSMGLNILT